MVKVYFACESNVQETDHDHNKCFQTEHYDLEGSHHHHGKDSVWECILKSYNSVIAVEVNNSFYINSEEIIRIVLGIMFIFGKQRTSDWSVSVDSMFRTEVLIATYSWFVTETTSPMFSWD